MTLLRKIPALSLAAMFTAAAGCAPPADGGQDLPVTCEGKCDGFDSVHSLLRDASKLDTNDFLSVGAGQLWTAAAKALNLSVGGLQFASIAIQPAKAYAQNRFNQLNRCTSSAEYRRWPLGESVDRVNP